MSIFGNILSSIFGEPAAAETTSAPTEKAADESTVAAAAKAPVKAAAKVTAPETATAAGTKAAAGTEVDVAAILDGLTRQSKEKNLEWRKSIVDMMKLLNLDSSLGARKELAEELHYTGNMKNSAEMNVWLHKQVMIQLAENGGKVPDELKA